MPVKVPDNLPAVEVLQNENVFIMTQSRATQQDIRPLRIAILNLMPTKMITEQQLLRVIGNSPLQVDIVLLHTASHTSKNTSPEHLATFYKTFEEVKHLRFDGLIITGAPVETLDFEDVVYWEELRNIMDWANTNVFSTFYICWAAQAGLYHHYGIQKYPLEDKLFGVFPHKVCEKHEKLVRGFDDLFFAPHSRYTELRREDIIKQSDLILLSESDEAGVYLVASRDGRHVFVTGHGEYDPDTLHREYVRDLERDLPIELPKNYFLQDDPSLSPVVKWRAHGNLLYLNWINYYVYQETPYAWTQET